MPDASAERGFVLDASVALAFLFDEPEFDAFRQRVLPILEAGQSLVPALWRTEVVNGILQAVRRNKILPEDARRLAGDVDRLELRVERDGPGAMLLLNLARQFGLTAYDALYLELAQRRGVPLATLDQELRSAARAAGIALIE